MKPPNFNKARLDGRISPKILVTQKFLMNAHWNAAHFCENDIAPAEENTPVLKNRSHYETRHLGMLQIRSKYALIVGAGPSLDKNVKLLTNPTVRELLECVDIYTTDSSYPLLRELDIPVSAVVSCEMDWPHVREGFEGTTKFLEKIPQQRSAVDGTILLMNLFGSHGYLRKWPGNYLFYIPDVCRFARWWWPHQEQWPADIPVIVPRAANVGFHAIEICKYLEYEEVWTIGMDMCVTGDNAHYSGFDEFLPNSLQHKAFTECLEHLKRDHKGDFGIPVVNCTEGGALDTGIKMTLRERLKLLQGELQASKVSKEDGEGEQT